MDSPKQVLVAVMANLAAHEPALHLAPSVMVQFRQFEDLQAEGKTQITVVCACARARARARMRVCVWACVRVCVRACVRDLDKSYIIIGRRGCEISLCNCYSSLNPWRLIINLS